MSAKIKTAYVCQECGYDTASWLGKCPECGTWNSLKEIHLTSSSNITQNTLDLRSVQPQVLGEIAHDEKLRIQTEYAELNTVLGGGIVQGSASLIAGDPGVGKSTLLLQISLSLAKSGKKVLYISGEESAEQIKMRALRLMSNGQSKDAKINQQLLLLSATNVDAIIRQIESVKPDLVIIDSIQTMESQNASGFSGSVAQVRYSGLQFVRVAKQLGVPVFIVGHVTKEGMVAGPMILTHMVDTVLFLEGEKFAKTRILRSLKNRFGPVDEVGIFVMDEKGMQEAKNPESLFLEGVQQDVPGSVLVATLEGSRAFLVELQALTVFSKLPMPRRVVSGIDSRRVELLLAVLQRHARLPVDNMDVFVNIVGGLKVADPAIDLGICLAIYSSLKNIPIGHAVGISEVGLLGELRLVTGLDKRKKEAEKLGYKKIYSANTHPTLLDVLKTVG